MRNRQATETKILDAAEAILVEGSFADLGVNAIAARAKVGKPLVYRYFGSVDEIGVQLLDRLTPQIIEKKRDIGFFKRGFGHEVWPEQQVTMKG